MKGYIEVIPPVNPSNKNEFKNTSEPEVIRAVVIEDGKSVKEAPAVGFEEAHIIEDEQPVFRSGRVGGVKYVYASGDPNRDVPLGSIFGTLVKRMLGIFFILIGIPMLLLPGPGVASIALGLFLLFAPFGSAAHGSEN